MKQAHHAAKGHARKHTHARKHVHHHHAKHHPKHHKKPHHHHTKAKVHTVGHHQQHAKGLAVSPGDVACCVSQALGESLRLQGLPVSDAGVLALHRAAGADDDRGAPILAVLEAASEAGLAGVRLASFFAADAGQRLAPAAGVSGLSLAPWRAVPGHVSDPAHRAEAFGTDGAAALGIVVDDLRQDREHFPGVALVEQVHDVSVILGVDLPGPHTVLATPEGWWSWGELFCPWCDFPDAVVDEAWAVSWQ